MTIEEQAKKLDASEIIKNIYRNGAACRNGMPPHNRKGKRWRISD